MPCSRVFSVSLARCAVTKVTDVSLASREIAASTAPGPHEIDPLGPYIVPLAMLATAFTLIAAALWL